MTRICYLCDEPITSPHWFDTHTDDATDNYVHAECCRDCHQPKTTGAGPMTRPPLQTETRQLLNAADALWQQALRRPPGHPHDEAYALAEIRNATERIRMAQQLLDTPPVPLDQLTDRSRQP